MSRVLITSGPTREYLDPIRFISNESSGKMGAALAAAALEQGHEVVVISGPVQISYPSDAELIQVVTTDELDEAVQVEFPKCDGIIGAAAPCDFRPRNQGDSKIKKTGHGIVVEFDETSDILREVARSKRDNQWAVGFALETDNGIENAKKKLKEKNLDLIVLNGPGAMNSDSNQVRIIADEGVVDEAAGTKRQVANKILATIQSRLMTSNLVD